MNAALRPALARLHVALAGGAFLAGGIAGLVLARRAGREPPVLSRTVSIDFWSIFGQNARVVVCLAVGVLTLGLFTLAILVFNGVVVGVAAGLFVEGGLGTALWTGLAPHFLPEVGGFVVAAAADLWLVSALAVWLRSGVRPAPGQFISRWLLPQLVALGLIVAAALVETYVSRAVA